MMQITSDTRFIFFKGTVLILWFFLLLNPVKAQPRIGPPQSWVESTALLDTSVAVASNAFQYFLIDNQLNIQKESAYLRQVYKILNSSGIQSLSALSVTYDPSYQQLIFHELKIIRNGSIVYSLKASDIELFQRELSMDRYAYDGSVSAVVNFKDVRVGDLVDYSYTIEGFNPANNGNVSFFDRVQFTVPVNFVKIRILYPEDKYLGHKLFNACPEPEKEQKGSLTELRWELPAKDFVTYESNTPSWFTAGKRVQISSYPSWKAVHDHILPLFKISAPDWRTLKLPTDPDLSEEENILRTIRWVQNEVRYLAFFGGTGAFKPNKPQEVFNNRYGDCKDKSLLLVAMLRKMGLEAYPVLVHSIFRAKLSEILPSNSFDHCAVCLFYHGKRFFIDPTLSNQGGDLYHISFPDFKCGLILRAGEKNLTEIPDGAPSSINVQENFYLDSVNGRAFLGIETYYYNAIADRERGLFKEKALHEIQRQYLNYYSNAYPSIETDGDISFYNGLDESENVFRVTENYIIPNAWQKSEEDDCIYFEYYPILVDAYTSYPGSSVRDMPYEIGNKLNFKQETEIVFPEEWYLENNDKHIAGCGFSYKAYARMEGRKAQINYQYETDRTYIPADSTLRFLKQHDEIRNNLSWYFPYEYSADYSQYGWIVMLVMILLLTAFGLAAFELHRKYNPKPIEPERWKSIGGWLILPLLGLALSPLRILYDMFNEEMFDPQLWCSLIDFFRIGEGVLAVGFLFAVLIDAALIAFVVLLIVQFVQRRSSLPRLYMIYLLSRFVLAILNYAVFNFVLEPDYFDAVDFAESVKEIAASFLAMIIWIPYFNISKRVKETFTRTYDKKNENEF